MAEEESSFAAANKRCRAEMDSLPVSMVPPKKRAWKSSDNQIDLNIRSPPTIYTRAEGLELLNRTIFSQKNDTPVSDVVIDIEERRKSDQIGPNSFPLESNGACSKPRNLKISVQKEENKKHKTSLPCQICGQEFQSNKKLLIHMYIHPDGNQDGISKSDLSESIKEEDKEEIFLCDSCPENFRTENQLQKHFRSKHSNKRSITSHKILKTEMSEVIALTKNSNPRQILNKGTNALQKRQGGFECEICSVKFMKRGMLLCHITKTHPLTSKGQFSSLTDTVKHEDKAWMCPYCDRKYLSSGKRREHIKKSHPDCDIPPSIKKAGRDAAHVTFIQTSQRQPHNCPYCPMEYAHRTKLLKHCKEKHKDQPVPYKYNKWKARDSVAREERVKARDVEKMLKKPNLCQTIALPQNKNEILENIKDSQMLNLKDSSIGPLDFFCDSTNTCDSNQSSITQIHTEGSAIANNQTYPFFDEDTFPEELIDEDTRHSNGSYQSISDAPPINSVMSDYRSHVTTPSSEILCKNELEITPETQSKSLPAQDLLHFLPLPQEIEARAMSDVQRAVEETRSTGDYSISNSLSFNATQTEDSISRGRNAAFDPSTMRHMTTSLITSDLSASMLDVCDDSAHSAPPNFTFDADTLIRPNEPSTSRDAGDLLQQAMQQAIMNETPDSGSFDRINLLTSIKISELNNNPDEKTKSNQIPVTNEIQLSHGHGGTLITSQRELSPQSDCSSNQIAYIRPNSTSSNIYLIEKTHNQPVSTTQTYRIISNDLVCNDERNSRSNSVTSNSLITTVASSPATITAVSSTAPTNNQVIQYIPQHSQAGNNIITLMPSNLTGANWSNQQLLKTSPSRKRNKSPAIIKRRFQSPKKSLRLIRPKMDTTTILDTTIQNLTPVFISNFEPTYQYVINGPSTLNTSQLIYAADLPKN